MSLIHLLRHAHARRGTPANDGEAVENFILLLSFNFASLVIVILLKAWAGIHRLGF